VQVGAIRYRVTDVDPHAEANGSIWLLLAIVHRNLLLHLDSETDCAVDAIKHYQ